MCGRRNFDCKPRLGFPQAWFPKPYVFSRGMCRANQQTCHHVSLEHSRANGSNSNSFFVRTVQLLSNQLPFCCFLSQYNVDFFKSRENSQLTCRIQTSVRFSAVVCLFVCLFFYKIKRHSFSNALQIVWYKRCLGWILHKMLYKSILVATFTTSRHARAVREKRYNLHTVKDET